MKEILVPCDSSAESKAAYQVALELAARRKCNVILLHAVDFPFAYAGGVTGESLSIDPVSMARLEETARKELETLVASKGEKKVKTSVQIVFGSLISSITRALDEYAVDLIVMGTTGASGLKDIFVGSNTEKVVRFSSVPVLAVRQPFSIDSIKNILLPSTLDLNQRDFIGKVKELREFFRATLHLLVVNTPSHFRTDTEATEAMEEFARHYKLQEYKFHFRNDTNEETGIINFARHEKMDIIVMGTHSRRGLAHLFNRSITEDVVNHIPTPIWAYTLRGSKDQPKKS